MRFVAAQFNALLDAELWLRNARHSNEMAALLYDAVAGLDGVDVAKPQVNGLFPTLPRRRHRPAAGVELLLGLGRRRTTRCAG